jgi:hypothetical protein
LPKFVSDAGGCVPSILANLVQVPRERYADSDEMKVRLRSRDAVFSDCRDMADEGLEVRVVTGRRHDGVGIQA